MIRVKPFNTVAGTKSVLCKYLCDECGRKVNQTGSFQVLWGVPSRYSNILFRLETSMANLQHVVENTEVCWPLK